MSHIRANLGLVQSLSPHLCWYTSILISAEHQKKKVAGESDGEEDGEACDPLIRQLRNQGALLKPERGPKMPETGVSSSSSYHSPVWTTAHSKSIHGGWLCVSCLFTAAHFFTRASP